MSHYELGSAPDQTTTAIKWPHDSLAAHLAVGVGSTAARYSDSGSPGGFAPLTHNHSGSAAATLRIPSLAASYSNNNSMGGSVYNRFLPALQPQPQPQPGLVTAPSTQQQSDAAQKLFAQLTNSANTTTTQHLSQFVNQQHHLYMAAAAEEAKLLDSSQKLIQDWRDRTSKLAVTTKPISNATGADQLWLDEQKTNLVHQLAQPYQKHLIQQRLTATTPPNITTSPPFIPQPQPPAHSPVRSSHSSTPSLLTPSASQQQQLATVQQHQSAAALVTAAASLLSTDERIGTNLSTSNTTLVETSRISIPDSTTTGTLIDGAKNGGAFTSFKHTSSSVIMQSHSSKGDAERDDIMEMNDQMNGVEHGAQIEDAPMKEVDSEYAELMCGGSSSVGSSTKSDMDILDEETHVASSSNSSSSSNTIKDGSNQNVLNQKGDKELLLHALSNQQQLRSVLDYDVDENNGDDTMRTAVAQQNEHQIKGEKVIDEWTDEVKRRPSTDTTYIISNGTTQPKEEDSNSPRKELSSIILRKDG
ncbi:unnamed protein product [Anisakis simplex]|uniref:POU domain protein n=1 Tax=Anisakis simplex TaxID=6269 RepID=A0A0M3JVT8_ANISI|nr:unnamed protein product [Anisakis simplex]